MKKKSNNVCSILSKVYNCICKYAPIIVLAFTLFLVIQLNICLKNKVHFDNVGVDYNEGWKNEDNKEVTLEKLSKYVSKKDNKQIIIHKKLEHKDIDDEMQLCFRTLNLDVKGYIDGKKVFENETDKFWLSTKSSGINWITYKIKEHDIGKQLELHVKFYYDDINSNIKYMKLAPRNKYIIAYLRENALILINTLVIIVLSVIYIIIGFIFENDHKYNTNKIMIAVGSTSLILATWLLVDTHIIQFFTNKQGYIQLLSCALLFLCPIPIINIFKYLFIKTSSKACDVLVFLTIILNAIVWTLQLLNIKDLRELLSLCHIWCVICVSILIILARNYYVYERKNKDNIDKKHRKKIWNYIFVIVFVVLLVYDFFAFYIDRMQDMKGIYIYLSTLFIYYSFVSFHKVIEVKKEIEHEKVMKKLAYVDGLTGISNRTAYKEMLEKIENNRLDFKNLGIIVFDVNNLKKVNDSYGHLEGDNLIIGAAGTISDAFNECCNVYRTGGDEFVVIIDSPNCKEIYNNNMIKFAKNIEKFNTQVSDYKLTIAHGISYCNINDSVEEKIKEADKKMYENKIKIKASLI